MELLKTTYREISQVFGNVKSSVPPFLFYYFIIYLSIVFVVFVFYIPGNDFDTLSSYIARIKLEEFGDLSKTATLEIQYIFPQFFDYLHKPFLDIGFFTTFPNFFLFMVFLFVLFRFHDKKYFFYFIILILSCQPILVSITSLKNDFSLAIITFITWFFIFRTNSKTFYLPILVFGISIMVGIKWHGFITAFLVLVPGLFRLIKDRLINSKASMILALSVPLMYWFSSADIYLNNLFNEGSLMPRPDYLFQSENINFFLNFWWFFYTNLILTFAMPIILFDNLFNTGIWGIINLPSIQNTIMLNFKHQIFFPDSITVSFGIGLFLILVVNFFVIIDSRFSVYSKSTSIFALSYTLILLSILQYSTWSNRYFILSYVMSIIPASEFFYIKLSTRNNSRKTLVKTVVVFYAIIVSLHVLLFNREKPLVSIQIPVGFQGDQKEFIEISSIWENFTDRDTLYFSSSLGYRKIYDFFRQNIERSDSLLLINKAEGGDCPYIYPFIKDREPANTRIFNTRYGDSFDNLIGKFDFIAIYRDDKLLEQDKRYELVYSYNETNEFNIYQRKYPTPGI